jgi:hypothetical protein
MFVVFPLQHVAVNNEQLWFPGHDGIATGANMEYNGLLQSSVDLMHSSCRGKEACIAIYA